MWYINILRKVTCFKLVSVRLLECNDCWGFSVKEENWLPTNAAAILMWNELLLQKLQGWELVRMCVGENFHFEIRMVLSLQKARGTLSVLEELPRNRQCPEASKIWGLFWYGWREGATGRSLSAGGQSSGVDFEWFWNLCGIYQHSSGQVYEIFTVHFEAKD